jgi:hypothetical protein
MESGDFTVVKSQLPWLNYRQKIELVAKDGTTTVLKAALH